MEQPKIIRFDNSEERYLKLADQKIEVGNFADAISLLFSALEVNPSVETLMDIADAYSQAGLYELSNKYWFYYLEKAPKGKLGVAYEELAINFFYMDDLLASGYYFHQKISVDGFISREGLDQEIIDFFSGEETKKSAYYIAYPFDRADYSYAAKRAKRALSSGNYAEAIKLFNAIPEECLTEETAGDKAISYLMNDMPDEAAAIARESLARHGENITAYCNLSNVYDFKEDFEKSEYYYAQALALKKGEDNEEYKLATCAIERSDHKTVRECLEKIVKERPYETVMRFFLGLAKINLGEMEEGYKDICAVYRLDKTDLIYKFYARYVGALLNNSIKVENLFPVKYLKQIPEKYEKTYEKAIGELIKNPVKIPLALKNRDNRDMLEWGLNCSERARECVYILANDFSPYSRRILKGFLMDNQAETSIKQVVLYALVVNGVKEKISVADRNFLFRVKPKKLAFERDKEDALYVCAYAIAFSRMAFLGVENLDKIADKTNRVYKKLGKLLGKEEVTSEELAGLIVLLCEFARFDSEKAIARVFEIKKDKLQTLKKLYAGEKND